MKSLLFLLFFASLVRASYTVPIGIPDPSLYWGALHPVDTPNPTRTTIAPGWFLGTPRASTKAQGDPADCYYVDSSAVGATNTSNPNGYPGKARLTVPSVTFGAGDYIEIHGDGGTGTYKYSSALQFKGLGTEANPVFIVGINSPLLSAKMEMGAFTFPRTAYVIVDGLLFKNTGRVNLSPRFDNNAIDHICFRNCNFVGDSTAASGNGFSAGASNFTASRTISDIFLYNCDIGYYGSKTAPNEECGVYPSINLTRFWVTDCDIHDCAEDGMAGGHGVKRTLNGYYIGRNHIHDNVTNCIDIKQADNVVISSNELEDAKLSTPHTSGAGEAVVLHYSGTSSPGGEFDAWKNWPGDVTVVNNIFHDSDFGVVTSSINKCRIVGNVFYNINHSTTPWDPASAFATGTGVHCRGVRGNLYIANNTFYNCDNNIELADTYNNYSAGTTYYRGSLIFYPTTNKVYECILDNSGASNPAVGISGIAPSNATYWREFRYQVWGNIGSARAEATGVDLFISAAASTADYTNDIDYNLFYHSGGAHYCYGGSTQHDLTWLQANSPHQDHGLSSDPQLVAPGSLNFALTSGSPAEDSGTEGTGTTAYQDFTNLFTDTLKIDRALHARPQGAAWDMGAYEISPVSGNNPVVTITAPADGAAYLTTNSISFTGTATDIEDGTISSNIVWSSNLDGSLGTGASISHTLTAGTHLITALITDSGTNVDFKTVTLTVTPPPRQYRLRPLLLRR